LVAEIYIVVGKRGRSAFLTKAAERELMRLRQIKALESAAGSWKDKDHRACLLSDQHHRGLRRPPPQRRGCHRRAFASLQHISITPPAARLAGELKRNYARKGKTLNLGAVIIAAVAIYNELTLLTGNVKDFPMKNLLLYPLPNA
jgi:hypothetical protein